jgi:MFS superfamily sulfate permease-like transporter
MAGASVSLMLIPQAVAYAALAGMPLITGIYAAFLPSLLAVLFSASHRLSVGPTALTATLVFSSLTGLADPGSQDWVNLAVWLCLLSGGLQLLLGFAKFGWLLNLVSSPVLAGFTQAAAVFIVLSQVPALLACFCFADGLGQSGHALVDQKMAPLVSNGAGTGAAERALEFGIGHVRASRLDRGCVATGFA